MYIYIYTFVYIVWGWDLPTTKEEFTNKSWDKPSPITHQKWVGFQPSPGGGLRHLLCHTRTVKCGSSSQVPVGYWVTWWSTFKRINELGISVRTESVQQWTGARFTSPFGSDDQTTSDRNTGCESNLIESFGLWAPCQSWSTRIGKDAAATSHLLNLMAWEHEVPR